MTLLQAQGVHKRFGGFRALGGVNLSMAAGEIRGLIGPNGAGKSTFINVLSGHIEPTAGSVKFRGEEIAGLKAHQVVRRGVARSFQITSIFPGYTVFQNVQVALMAQSGLCGNWLRASDLLMRDQAAELLGTVGLQGAHKRVAGELAAGDRKRLEFAISLAAKPSLLLLDEPTAGMSPAERAVVIEIILSLNRERGVAVLLTEHDIDMVFGIAHRITVLHQGELLAEGTPAEVRANGRVQQVYLGEDAHAEML
jgi:branched-chain amino acid transport system ATP-binding protein